MKTPLNWYFRNASINFAQSRQGKSNHCNYSSQYCKNTTLLVWNSCNLILAWLNYRNMIETFQERWKGFHYFSSMKYPLKISIFEVDYVVLFCLAQNLTFWKLRKKLGYFFGSFEKSLVDFWKNNLATLVKATSYWPGYSYQQSFCFIFVCFLQKLMKPGSWLFNVFQFFFVHIFLFCC